MRLRPQVFAELWYFFGTLDIDLIASPASAHCLPAAAWGGAIGSHVSRATRMMVPREWIFFSRCISRSESDNARVRFLFSPYRSGQPSRTTFRRATSTRGHFIYFRSGFLEPRMEIGRKRSLIAASTGDKTLLRTTSEAPSHMHFLGGIWSRLRSISPAYSWAKQVVSVYTHTQILDEENRACL